MPDIPPTSSGGGVTAHGDLTGLAAADSGHTGFPLLALANTFTTGPQTIQTGAAGTKGLIVTLASSPTVPGIQSVGSSGEISLSHTSGGRRFGIAIGSSDDGTLRFIRSDSSDNVSLLVGSTAYFNSSATNGALGFQVQGTGSLNFGSASTTSACIVRFGVRPSDAAQSNAALHQFYGASATFNLPVTVTGALAAASLNLGGATVLDILTATATLEFDATDPHDLTITVTGAALGDTVAVGVPHDSVGADSMFFGWVSAADTVTVRKKGTANPASGTFRATVVKI